jgi:hypothetical protein
MAAETAINHMLQRGSISICTIDQILKITGGVPEKEDYEILRLLHCVDFKDYPRDLLRGLPVILQRVLGAESLQFKFQDPERKLMLVK